MSYNNLSPEETLNLNLKLQDTDVGWLAGLLEGEGTFGNDMRTTSKKFPVPAAPYIKLRMSDKDVVDKFASLVKKNVTQLKAQKGAIGTKPIYSCQVGDRGTVYYLLNKILPYMGERRKKEIEQQLQYIKDWVQWYDKGGRNRNKFHSLKPITKQINVETV